jgi:hypothetical protein
MRFLLSVLLALAFLAAPAFAHSWYSEKVDPVFRNSCCGGSDCGMWRIQEGEIMAERDGLHVRLSLDRSRLINPYSVKPIDALVTWNRVQPSEDGNWHICISSWSRDGQTEGIYCLFAPPNT